MAQGIARDRLVGEATGGSPEDLQEGVRQPVPEGHRPHPSGNDGRPDGFYPSDGSEVLSSEARELIDRWVIELVDRPWREPSDIGMGEMGDFSESDWE